MRKYILMAAMVVGGLFAGAQGAGAQSAIMNLPRQSQHAMVSQRVGITDITINYHRPLVGGRKVFGPGSAQAYGQVWRAGANENTTIEFTSDVMVEGKPLAKGVYGLHMIPGETDWTIIFSKNSTSWGSFTYDQAEDALRVTVKSHPAEMEEALAYDFDNVKANEATIVLRWEKVAVPVQVSVDTNGTVLASLHNQLRARAQYEWPAWSEASEYLMANKMSADEALKDADRSIAIEDRFENEMDRAQALDLLNRADEAKAEFNATHARYAAQHGALEGPAVKPKPGQTLVDMFGTIAGNPDTVAAKVQELADIGINHLLVRFIGDWTATTRPIAEASMRLFSREIMPRFKDLAPLRDPLALDLGAASEAPVA